MKRSVVARLALLLGCWSFMSAGSPGAEVELINARTPWRACLVVGPTVAKDGAVLRLLDERSRVKPVFDPASAEIQRAFSRPPVEAWMKADYDASSWARYLPNDLDEYLGGYGVPRAAWGRAWPALLCLRTRFGIADPALARDLKVTVTCLGGAVVYVNGREAGRGFLAQGQVRPLTLAEPYPIEAYTIEDGVTPLPEITGRAKGSERAEPEAEHLARYRSRIRTIAVSVPAGALVKGSNVLAVEIHQAPTAGPFGRAPWAHLGVQSVTLTSASGAGVIPYEEAVRGTRLWSANPEDQIADTPSEASLVRRPEGRPVLWMRGKAFRGIPCGNPFDPVLPVRMAAPRNGVASGQAVVTDLAGLRGLSAKMGPLQGPGGEIPAAAVEVRYAAQHEAIHFCDALLPFPPEEARTVPVWLIVQVPKGQAPGWYTGRLGVKAGGKDFSAPLQVLVTGATVPDAKDFAPTIGAASSPDTIALHYGVEPWSEEHFRLMEPSLRMLGQLGNDVLRVPVVLGGMSVSFRNKMTAGSAGPRFRPLVRWVQESDRLRPDFSLLEKYLDAYMKHCAPPRALSLYVWEAGCSKEIGFAYENSKIAGSATADLPGRPGQPTSPLLVLQWDPKTGEASEVEAPAPTDEGAEAFWKPLFDGVRAIVVKRGWSERIIMAGLGGDLRPGEKTGEVLRQWAPYVRWDILSHFSGDPGPKGGKLFATGGLEVGLKGYPWRAFMHPFTAAEWEKELAEPLEYLDLPTARWHWQDDSPPFIFRTLPLIWGSLGQLGLDFWIRGRGAPRNSSFFTASEALTVPGPDGAAPTVRFQMLREGVQDMDLRLAIIRAYERLPEERRQAWRDLLDEFLLRAAWGAGYLSQHELGYDWRAYAAKVQAAAAELGGVRTDAAWEKPPG